jgi:WD40 repeat protein
LTTPDHVFSVVFTPGGRTVAVGTVEGTVSFLGAGTGKMLLWDVSDRGNPQPSGQPLTTPTPVSWLAFTGDGRTLVTIVKVGGAAVVLWDVSDRGHPQPLGWPHGFSDPVSSLASTPDGRTMIISAGEVTLWDVSNPRKPHQLGQPLTAPNPVWALSLSSDGRTLAAGSGSGPMAGVGSGGDIPAGAGSVQLWDVADPGRPRRIGQPVTFPDPVTTLAFIPGGRTLAVGTGGGTGGLTFWDVSQNSRPRPLGQPFTFPDPVSSLAFNPGGRAIAVGVGVGIALDARPGRIVILDTADPAHPHPLGQPLITPEPVRSLSFAPDGRTLAAASGSVNALGNGTVALWDTTDPAHPRPLGQPLTTQDPAWSVAFTPDGGTLAAGTGTGVGCPISVCGGTGGVVLWDMADARHPRRLGLPVVFSYAVLSLAPVPHLGALAAGAGTLAYRDPVAGAIALLDLTPLADVEAHAVERSCEIMGGGLTPEDWDYYIPGLPYQDTCRM